MSKPYNKYKIYLFLMTLLIVAFGTRVALADGANFNVVPNLPENQISKNSGYFDLFMKPGESQDLTIKLSNTTSKAITVDTTFSNATTADSGLAVYVPSTKPKDKSLVRDISDYVTIDKQVKIPADSTVEVKAKVKMPEESFKGVMAGGFTFKQVESETDQANSSKKTSVTVKNEYRYVIALVMRQSEESVAPSLALNTVKASQVNSRNVIQANLSNSAPAYLSQLNVSSTVTSKTDSQLSYTYNNSAMQMAPNSNFDLAIPVSKQGDLNGGSSAALKPGKYHLHLIAYGEKSTDGKYETTVDGNKVKYKYKWEFDKDFEVTSSEAEKLNKTDPTVEKQNFNWLIIIGIIIIILLIILIFLLFKKRKKEDKEESKKG
ncbi:DUF916 and DUF3324 domain-containing protein [Lactococcus taiwanensis]|uniref:DUF916 and DUF3324 domain-containing protein n=2 Tax=Lactococcus taiwanensis TaxID=1151742 RepID=UPI0035157FE7